ncbi:MAG: endopeptidase La [Succinivibrionaceae bacterium]
MARKKTIISENNLETDGSLPLIYTDHIVLPQTVCVIQFYEIADFILNTLREGIDKFILFVNPANNHNTNFQIKNLDDINANPLLVCTILERNIFKDRSRRYVVRVEGRATAISYNLESHNFDGKECPICRIKYNLKNFEKDLSSEEISVYKDSILQSFKSYIEYAHEESAEKERLVKSAPNLLATCDLLISFLNLSEKEKFEYLKYDTLTQIVIKTKSALDSLFYKEKIEKEIKAKAKEAIDKNQKHYYLSEQLKVIQKEISKLYNIPTDQDQDDPELIGESAAIDEISKMKKRVSESGMPKEIAEKCYSEIKKLSMQSPLSPDSGIVRNYIETLLNLPWTQKSEINKDLSTAEKILNQDHYGLEKVKERILEYLAVQSRSDRLHSPIICLVGPPGVGKTSLGRSIAKATGREYVRIALGGMHDEAEIRGHRRTYLGALPGKIIQKMTKCGVKNPLFLLDEIDKISQDTLRGDPCAALLEVLDPEQNKCFADNYLEVDYDLSDVMFMATSNSMNIPPALIDRMEIINLSSYTEDEKLHIAQKHLIPKQFEANAVNKNEISINKDAVIELIRRYTHEAGVRNLEREIGRLCRKGIKEILLSKGKTKSIKINAKKVIDYLGPEKYDFGAMRSENKVGIVNGLAYTSVGGDILTIETVVVPGVGKQVFTGKLGDVMKESIAAAMTVVRARSSQYDIPKDFLKTHDIHIHCPEGAVPKDGPSAGIAMCTAILSAMTNVKVRGDVAMTGEITLRGEVLPIGGLREKLLAAQRGCIKKVLIPKENVKDLDNVPQIAKDSLEIIPVKYIEDVFLEALEPIENKKNSKRSSKKEDKTDKTKKSEVLENNVKSATKNIKNVNEVIMNI